MEYTVQELAKAARVSVRTLRYYEEIGLLMPGIRMANGRNLYGVEAVLALVHILSLRELRFSLKKIGVILGESSNYKVCALAVQKKILIKEQERLKANLQMVDSMITCYKGESKMNHKELEKFRSRPEYQKLFDESYRKELVQTLEKSFRKEYFEEVKKRGAEMSIVDAAEYGKQGGLILSELIQAMTKGEKEDSEVVQELMRKQKLVQQMIHPPIQSKRIYFAIRDQLCNIPAKLKEGSSPGLFDFMYKAMTIFGEAEFV